MTLLPNLFKNVVPGVGWFTISRNSNITLFKLDDDKSAPSITWAVVITSDGYHS